MPSSVLVPARGWLASMVTVSSSTLVMVAGMPCPTMSLVPTTVSLSPTAWKTCSLGTSRMLASFGCPYACAQGIQRGAISARGCEYHMILPRTPSTSWCDGVTMELNMEMEMMIGDPGHWLPPIIMRISNSYVW